MRTHCEMTTCPLDSNPALRGSSDHLRHWLSYQLSCSLFPELAKQRRVLRSRTLQRKQTAMFPSVRGATQQGSATAPTSLGQGRRHAARGTPGTLSWRFPPRLAGRHWPSSPGTQREWRLLACFQEGRGQLRSASYVDTSQPGIIPGVRDDLGMAEALCARAAPLCAHCGWGFWAQSNAWLCPNGNRPRTLGFWRCSRAEATEDGSICAGLSLSNPLE